MSCWSNIEGTWSYSDLIGSKFKIKSIRLSSYGQINKSGAFSLSGQELTLKAVYFRASTDGKVLTLFRMEEVCGKLFLPKDLELIEISPVSNISTVCGQFSPCSKNLVGISNEPEEESSSNNNAGLEDPSPVSHLLKSSPQSEMIKDTKDIVIKDDDPFLHNINEWEIICL